MSKQNSILNSGKMSLLSERKKCNTTYTKCPKDKCVILVRLKIIFYFFIFLGFTGLCKLNYL